MTLARVSLTTLFRSPGIRCNNPRHYSSYETLLVNQIKPFVFHVEFNRPSKANAINTMMWKEMSSVFTALGRDENCRAIILSGQGRLFTGGIDLADLGNVASITSNTEFDPARKAKKLFELICQLQDSITSIEKCIKPVISAIHGSCIGAGVDIITATDIRLCSKDAYFQVKEVDLGLAADVGTLQRLPRVIGNDSIARELAYTSRVLGSLEALSIGLVSRVSETKETLLNDAYTTAELIASKSPVAVSGTKVNLLYGRDHSVSDGLEYVARWNSLNLQSEDTLKAAMSQMTKSVPSFDKY